MLQFAPLLARASDIATALEGEYKWVVVIGSALLITIFVTRYIFKTIKWIFLVIVIGALVFGTMYTLANLTNW